MTESVADRLTPDLAGRRLWRLLRRPGALTTLDDLAMAEEAGYPTHRTALRDVVSPDVLRSLIEAGLVERQEQHARSVLLSITPLGIECHRLVYRLIGDLGQLVRPLRLVEAA